MLTVGQPFPAYQLTGVVSSDPETAFQTFRHDGFPGRWQVIFFWPKDFTFVCPTEIAAFAALTRQFAERGAQLLGASTDSDYVHLAWRQSHPALKDLPYPMLSDLKRELSTALGILDAKAGVCLRATFIVDPQGIIRHASVNDLSVGTESRGSVARARRAPDGRAVPEQLEAGRGHPERGVSGRL